MLCHCSYHGGGTIMTTEEVEISVVIKLPKGHYQVASGLATKFSDITVTKLVYNNTYFLKYSKL
jgi:hypothetical protein